MAPSIGLGDRNQALALALMTPEQRAQYEATLQAQRGPLGQLGHSIGAGIKKLLPDFGFGKGAESATAASTPGLGFGDQVGNILSGQPANAIGSAALPSGEAGTLLADGSVVGAGPSPLGYGLGALGLGAGAYGLYSDWGKRTPESGALSGLSAGLGAAALGLGPATPLAIAGALLGAGLGSIKTGKSEEQQARDSTRDFFQEQGFAFKPEGSSSHFVELADGSTYDIGRDGSKQTFTGLGGNKVHYGYESDWENPLTAEAAIPTSAFHLATTGMVGDHDEGAITSQLINAAVSNAEDKTDVLSNVKHFFDTAGVSQGDAFARIEEAVRQGKLDPEQHAAFNNAINEVFGQEYYREKDPNAPIVPTIRLGDFTGLGGM